MKYYFTKIKPVKKKSMNAKKTNKKSKKNNKPKRKTGGNTIKYNLNIVLEKTDNLNNIFTQLIELQKELKDKINVINIEGKDLPLNAPMPESIKELTNLKSLSLINCGLTGTVPKEIWKNENLKFNLNFLGNPELKGQKFLINEGMEIPKKLRKLEKLLKIDDECFYPIIYKNAFAEAKFSIMQKEKEAIAKKGTDENQIQLYQKHLNDFEHTLEYIRATQHLDFEKEKKASFFSSNKKKEEAKKNIEDYKAIETLLSNTLTDFYMQLLEQHRSLLSTNCDKKDPNYS